MRRYGVVIVLALGLTAAACGGGDDSSVATDSTTSSSTTTSTVPATTTTTSPPGPTTPTQPKPTTCQVANLAAQQVEGSPGAGQRYATITFTNNGSIACTMYGYIGLKLLGQGNTAVPTNVVRDPTIPKQLVTLAPKGGQSYTTLHWGVIPSGNEPDNGPCEPTAQQILITPPNETQSFTQPWTFGVVCQQGQISTDPVQPGAAPPSQ
jgi:Protein of unknown function (DUF4232)